MQELTQLKESPSQTAGPYVHIGCVPNFCDITGVYPEDLGARMVNAETKGERITVKGTIYDGTGTPLKDALVEIWQANAGGRYRHKKDTYFAPLDPNFGGCGRTITDDQGYYEFLTIRPGAYPWPNTGNDWRPAHIHFSVFGHAFGQRLITQMYFEGDPLIAHCPIVHAIPDRDAVQQLTAKLDLNATIPLDSIAYKFDIVLRGRRSTLFENRLEGN